MYHKESHFTSYDHWNYFMSIVKYRRSTVKELEYAKSTGEGLVYKYRRQNVVELKCGRWSVELGRVYENG